MYFRIMYNSDISEDWQDCHNWNETISSNSRYRCINVYAIHTIEQCSNRFKDNSKNVKFELLTSVLLPCSSMVIRDLTLRSAASFGSFHLIRLLYDEYMFYLVEHRVAQATGETPIGVMGEVCFPNLKNIPPLQIKFHFGLMICTLKLLLQKMIQLCCGIIGANDYNSKFITISSFSYGIAFFFFFIIQLEKPALHLLHTIDWFISTCFSFNILIGPCCSILHMKTNQSMVV